MFCDAFWAEAELVSKVGKPKEILFDKEVVVQDKHAEEIDGQSEDGAQPAAAVL